MYRVDMAIAIQSSNQQQETYCDVMESITQMVLILMEIDKKIGYVHSSSMRRNGLDGGCLTGVQQQQGTSVVQQFCNFGRIFFGIGINIRDALWNIMKMG